MEYVLGIDIGTSGTKTSLFNQQWQLVGSVTIGYEMQQLQVGWAEQDPDVWWQATIQSIRQLLQQTKIASHLIKGIGLTGQMHGLVMLDKNHRVLRPSILWCDQRSTTECVEITNELTYEKLIQITANPALPGFTAAKIRWVEKHEPTLFQQCTKIVLPKDYIRFQLTGIFATDVSDASGMQLLDINLRQWSPTMLKTLHLRNDQLGQVYEGPQITGKVHESAAKLTGLTVGTPVVAGAGDQAASAIGNGIVQEGSMSITIGSSGVVFASTTKPLIDRQGRVHTFCHAVPGLWHVMGVTQGAGMSLKWFKDQIGQDEQTKATIQNKNVYDVINDEINTVSIGSNGLLYLPYLNGERTPHLDALAKGCLIGLSSFHQRCHIFRAVMEGVTFSLRDCYGVFQEMKLTSKSARLAGGGANSDVWMQMMADVFQLPVQRTHVADAGTLGCAILAGVGIGWNPSVQDACNQAVKIKDEKLADPSRSQHYLKYYQLYRSLYPILKPTFKELGALISHE